MKRERPQSAVTIGVEHNETLAVLRASAVILFWLWIFRTSMFGMYQVFGKSWTISDDHQWRQLFFLQTLSAVVSVMFLSVSV